MGVSVTFFAVEKDDAGNLVPQLYKVDPSGHFVGYFALATGAKEVEAQSQLEKAMKTKHFREMSLEEAAECAVSTLQHVCGEALKGRDIEMAQVGADRKFRVVEADRIDAMLTTIAERD
jgi:20S proteasome subunit alpha 1